MPRQLRIQYEHTTYHVLARGNRREAIFRDDRDRKEFLCRLEAVCGKTGWSIRAFVLMGNHYDLVVNTLNPIWWRRITQRGEPDSLG